MSKKHKVGVKTYKIPVTRTEENKVDTEVTLELKEDMVVKQEEVELEDPLHLQLPIYLKNIKKYNDRQILFANADLNQTHYKKKIVTKPETNK